MEFMLHFYHEKYMNAGNSSVFNKNSLIVWSGTGRISSKVKFDRGGY